MSKKNIPKNLLDDLVDINNNLTELNKVIDKKNIEYQDMNCNYNKKIMLYKSMLENIILEHHNSCKELFKNNL